MTQLYEPGDIHLASGFVICYSYHLWKITSIQCTFVVSNVVSTIKSPAHSSCLTLHNRLFAWLLDTDLHTTYIKHTKLRTVLFVECIFDK